MFPQLAIVIDNAGDNLDVKCVQDTATEHLSNLVKRIQHYFPEQKDPGKGNEWIRNPFAPTVNVEKLNISVDLKDKLLDLSADGFAKGLQNSFESNSLASFWIKIKAEYPRLSGMAIKTLLPFPSTYLCEAGFSNMSCLKGKHRNALDIHAPLRVALSSIEPQLDKLVTNKQAHNSHQNSQDN